MAPQTRYLFVPVLLALVLAFAALADAVSRLVLSPAPPLTRAGLFWLGLSYSLVVAALPLSGALPGQPGFALTGAVLAAVLVVRFLR